MTTEVEGTEANEPTATPDEGKSGQDEAAKTEESATSGTMPTGGEKESGQDETPPTGEEKPGEPDEDSIAKAKKGTEKGVQKRIDKLRREKAENAEEAAYWKGRAEGQGLAGEPQKSEEEPLVKPQLDDFDTQEEHDQALDTYYEERADRRADERDAKREAASKKKATDEAYATRDAAFNERMAQAEDTMEGFEAVREFNGFSEAMLEGVKKSEYAPQLLHHLATHPEVHAEIAALHQVDQIYAMGRLEAELHGSKPVKQGKKGTGAPPPPTPIKGGGGPVVKDTYKMDAEATYHHEKQKTAQKQGKQGG